jgi:hypothetical protein
MKRLDEIARENGTDKSSEIHNYCDKYEKYLRFERNQQIKILEIGVLAGSSVKTWSEFYPNSTVVGIDINPHCKTYEQDRIKIEIGSQDDYDFLSSVVEKYGQFDLIIDDGSHLQQHVLKSFNFLFPYLVNGGTYVVEDSCCAYWQNFGGGLRVEGSSIEHFKILVDDVNFNGSLCDNFEPIHARREDMLEQTAYVKSSGIRTDIESINFLNSIVIITKR